MNFTGSSQRFSLYHLDEGEMFIKEFIVSLCYYTPEHNKIETNNGMLYIGSRSLIFEPDDRDYSLVKFNFQELQSLPCIDFKEDSYHFQIKRIIVIYNGNFTQAEKILPIPQNENQNEILVKFKFEKLNIVTRIINELIEKYNNKSSFFEFDSVEYLKSMYNFSFDLTLIKSWR